MLIRILFFCSINLLLGTATVGQTLWTGAPTTFSKAPYADWTLPENQDSISPNVCLTRADNQGIFNIKLEEEYDRDGRTSPADTEWANGSIADGVENLTFSPWFNHLSGPTDEEIGVPKVVHLISEDIYIDILFTQWTGGGGGSGTGFGGGFTYQRSTDSTTIVLGQNEVSSPSLKLWPNPTTERIFLSPEWALYPFRILNTRGQLVLQGTTDNQASISLGDLSSSLYFLEIQAEDTLLVKQFVVE